MNENQVGGSRTEHNGVLRGSRTNKLESLGSLSAKLRQMAGENPRTTLLAVGASAFALGCVMGSRLGRFALAAALPVVVSRVIDGSLSRDLMRWATGIPEAPLV